ncbi:hypothetical protein KIN20_007225 [Parelaphostrongylus tenuis]|uniref:Uncharacterized protein n=1 Tax=Parelaphostrongylus tenuis TaxID=148309 RepID=A0AAD5QIZ9_PARTN|nr:hypothetical protein KIN20_007225 [Parelaphostrongylus tenuis]
MASSTIRTKKSTFAMNLSQAHTSPVYDSIRFFDEEFCTSDRKRSPANAEMSDKNLD